MQTDYDILCFFIWMSFCFLLTHAYQIQLEAGDAHESLEEEWNLMQESILDNVVYIHNQLFGSTNLILSVSHLKKFSGLVLIFCSHLKKISTNLMHGSSIIIIIFYSLQSGTFQISDAERLLSFSDSYTLGLEMIKGDYQIFFLRLNISWIAK